MMMIITFYLFLLFFIFGFELLFTLIFFLSGNWIR